MIARFPKAGTVAHKRAVACPGSQNRARPQPLPSGLEPMLLREEGRDQEYPGLSPPAPPTGLGVPGDKPSASCGKKVRLI